MPVFVLHMGRDGAQELTFSRFVTLAFDLIKAYFVSASRQPDSSPLSATDMAVSTPPAGATRASGCVI